MILNTFSKKLQRFGLGNFIQGSYGLYEISKNLNIDFGIDFSDHPIANYLMPHITSIDKLQTPIYDISDRKDKTQTEKYISSLYSLYTRKGYDHVRFYYDAYDDDYDERPINKNIIYDYSLYKYFLPNDKTEKLIKREFKYSNYTVIHIRCGDHNSFIDSKFPYNDKDHKRKKTINQDSNYVDSIISAIEPEIISIKNNTKSPILLISDSHELKVKLSAIHNFHIINNVPSHTIEYDDFFYEVALDFFLLCKAQSIHQFCVYMRPSSFSYWPHVLFNIPFYYYPTISSFRE